MLMPKLIKQHKEIIDNAFLVTKNKEYGATIRLYDINGFLIAGLIVNNEPDSPYIDALIDGEWRDF